MPKTLAPRPGQNLASLPGGTLRALWILASIAVLIPAVLFVAAALLDRSATLRRAESDGRKTLALLHEQGANQFSGHEIILDAAAERVRGRSWDEIAASPDLLHDLELMDDRLDEATEILLVDAAGRVRATTVHEAGQPPAPDHACFAALRNGTVTCVSAPHRDSTTGRRLFSLARRLEENGEFRGVVQVAISVDYFLTLWGRVAHNATDSIVLLRTDGAILARYPERPNMPAHLPADDPLVEGMRQGDGGGIVRSRSPVDRVERILLYQRIAGYPVYIGIGIDRGAVLAEWRRHLLFYGIVVLSAAAALMAAAGVALRQAQREQSAVALWRAEVKEREEAQAKLLQSQKMDSIGQLTGGVAHDFNNLLTAVLGNLDLAIARPLDERVRELLQSAHSAAERGAVLTQRLLAFARKQLLEPAAVDVAALVHELGDLLVRALGPSVNLACEVEPGLWPALVDRNQLELIILNLAINARDAMPDGGTLTIALANRKAGGTAPAELSPGEYVVVSVSDTGIGMDEATLKRAFEPFFTTKEVGKGTGLGLSMVHGIVAQSGGATRLRSVVGQGTTVEIWLPRARELPVEQPPRAPAETPTTGGTILVCDDDPLVSELVVRCLQDAGYEAIAADGGGAALAVLDSGRPVNALVVDFAMPEMNGAIVARAARERRPGLPALLITGHADQATIEAEAGDLPILRKPFKQADLLRSVAELLSPRPETALVHATG